MTVFTQMHSDNGSTRLDSLSRQTFPVAFSRWPLRYRGAVASLGAVASQGYGRVVGRACKAVYRGGLQAHGGGSGPGPVGGDGQRFTRQQVRAWQHRRSVAG